MILRTALLLFALAAAGAAHASQATLILVPDGYDGPSCLHTGPALSEEEALSRALCDEGVKKSLLEMQRTVPYKAWQPRAVRLESENGWLVQITSIGALPPASCVIKISHKGKISMRLCRLEK